MPTDLLVSGPSLESNLACAGSVALAKDPNGDPPRGSKVHQLTLQHQKQWHYYIKKNDSHDKHKNTVAARRFTAKSRIQPSHRERNERVEPMVWSCRATGEGTQHRLDPRQALQPPAGKQRLDFLFTILEISLENHFMLAGYQWQTMSRRMMKSALSLGCNFLDHYAPFESPNYPPVFGVENIPTKA